MSWSAIFTLVNVIALFGWLLLFVGARGPKTAAVVLYASVGVLCLAYASMIVGMHLGWIDAVRPAGAPPPNFANYTIEGLQNLFVSDGGLVLGWTHYLAFDLFVGQWVAKDADHKGFSRLAQAPVLFLVLMVGPVGLLLWMVLRERRSRRMQRGL